MASKNGKKLSGEQIDLLLPAAALQQRHQYISRDLIEVDPEQPRQELDAELADSIRRTGILEPIIVRPHPRKSGLFMIVNGERRWRGAAGLQHKIPCILRDDQSDEQQRLVTQLVANTGKPLEPTEEAEAFARLVQLSGKSVAEVAEMIGRPRSTIGDRLALLDVGAWFGLIKAGEINVSHVVRVIVPLRGVPEQYHRKAIETMRKDYRWKKTGIALDAFERMADGAYRPFMYPLNKSNARYGAGSDRPTFDTSAHNKECDCGRILFKYDYSGTRACCGNPAWWGPLHRKALAAKKKKAKPGKLTQKDGPRERKFYLPEGSPTIKSTEYSDAPKGYVALSDTSGKWNLEKMQMDPRGAHLGSLVLVNLNGGSKLVATKATPLIAAARQAWRKRWDDRAVELSKPLTDAKKRKPHVVEGPGARKLLSLLLENDMVDEMREEIFGLAPALGLDVPEKFRSEGVWNLRETEVGKWVAGLKDDEVSDLTTAWVMSQEKGFKSPLDQLKAEKLRVEAAIEKATPSWLVAPKTPAPAKKKLADAKKKSASAGKAKKTGSKKKRAATGRVGSMVDEQFVPSPQLASVIGTGPFTRPEVTKRLWDHIKENGLQDKANRRLINGDELLSKIFGRDQVSMFDMVKILNKHLWSTQTRKNPEPVFNENSAVAEEIAQDPPPPRSTDQTIAAIKSAARLDEISDEEDEEEGAEEGVPAGVAEE